MKRQCLESIKVLETLRLEKNDLNPKNRSHEASGFWALRVKGDGKPSYLCSISDMLVTDKHTYSTKDCVFNIKDRSVFHGSRTIVKAIDFQVTNHFARMTARLAINNQAHFEALRVIFIHQ